MIDARIYHNPRCSKSRATLALLREHDIEPEIIEYLKTPPTAAEIDGVLALLAIAPRELMRGNEDDYARLGLGDTSLTHDELVQAMVDHPRLMQRPVVLIGDKAAIGRPPEAVLAIIPQP